MTISTGAQGTGGGVQGGGVVRLWKHALKAAGTTDMYPRYGWSVSSGKQVCEIVLRCVFILQTIGQVRGRESGRNGDWRDRLRIDITKRHVWPCVFRCLRCYI